MNIRGFLSCLQVIMSTISSKELSSDRVPLLNPYWDRRNLNERKVLSVVLHLTSRVQDFNIGETSLVPRYYYIFGTD